VTKAELFRYLAERSGEKRKPAARRERPAPRDAASAPRNLSRRAGKKAQFALEASAGTPSRKSTRKGANHQKNDVQFRMRRQVSEARPEDRPRPVAR